MGDDEYEEAKQRAEWIEAMVAQMAVASEEYERARAEASSLSELARDALSTAVSGDDVQYVAALQQSAQDALLDVETRRRELHSYLSGISGVAAADQMYGPVEDD